MLYQRYFLKMNQSNMTNLISLLLLLCVAFLLLAATDLIMVHHSEELPRHSTHRSDKLVVLICTSGCCIAIYGGMLIQQIRKIHKKKIFSAFSRALQARNERSIFNNNLLRYSSHISYIRGKWKVYTIFFFAFKEWSKPIFFSQVCQKRQIY